MTLDANQTHQVARSIPAVAQAASRFVQRLDEEAPAEGAAPPAEGEAAPAEGAAPPAMAPVTVRSRLRLCACLCICIVHNTCTVHQN